MMAPHRTPGAVSPERTRTGLVTAVSMATAAAVALLPLPGAAQAVCSAPHSAPVVSTGGPIQTLPAGSGWLQATAFRQVSSQRFDASGQTRLFLSDGEVRTSSLYLTGAIGLGRGVDLWLQLPVHDVWFEDVSGSRERTGIGDPRVALRIGAGFVGLPSVPLAIRAGVKFPGGDFPVDATLVPLGEGQRDWELSMEYGQALAGEPLYAIAWAGYRWREANESVGRDYGDELFTRVALGGALSRFSWELAGEGLSGRNPVFLGVELPGERRALLQVNPTVGYRVGVHRITAGAQIPLAGRNLPTGPALHVGYILTWDAR